MVTVKTVSDDLKSKIGQRIDADNAWGSQCVDTPLYVSKTYFGVHLWGNAIDLLKSAKQAGWPVEYNKVGDLNSYPREGWFFVMEVPGHDFGHTGYVLYADAYKMITLETNVDGNADSLTNGGPLRQLTRDYTGVIGWFRPPYSDEKTPEQATKSTGGKSTMEPKNINGDLYSGLITEARPEVFWSGGKRTSKIQYIVIHGTATTSVSAAYSTWLRSRNNMTSAHYLVTPNATMGCVGENYVAWHSGGEHTITNENSIGIEHINSYIGDVNDPNTYLFDDATLERGAKLVAEICLRYGLKPDSSVIVPHRQVSATACPQTLDMSDYIKRVQRYYKEMSGVVISNKENTTQKPAISKTETVGSFKVRVSVTDLNIRKEPSLKAKTNGKIKPGVYTITETKTADNYEWGKLKSGAGWIALKYVKRL